MLGLGLAEITAFDAAKGREAGSVGVRVSQKDGTMSDKTRTNDLLRFSTLMILAITVVSILTVFFVLHEETDDSSAQIMKTGQCGPDAYYMYFSDGSLELFGTGWTYNYSGTTHSPWFDYRTEITRIVIGEDISNLGAWTFVGCKNLKELTIPITLNSVGYDPSPAFAGCYKIEKINFTYGTDGNGYNYDAYNSGNNRWYQNTPWYESRENIKELNFADNIKSIGSDAFRELNLTTVVLPDSISGLGNHCFFNCTGLTDLTLPISLNSYGNETYPAFEGCMAVQKVTFTRGNGVAFDYSNWLMEPYCVTLAPWNMNRDVAKTIVISDDITTLGRYMFKYTNLGELTIPLSATPYSPGYTMVYSFYAPYDSLEKVTITKGNGSAYDYNSRSSVLYVPWNKAPNLKTVVVEEGVTRLGSYMFNSCSTEDLILPNTLNSLGESVFKSTVIKNLTIPISLNAVWLDKYPAFEGVHGIEKITFVPGTGYGFHYGANEDINCWYKHTPWYQCRYALREIVFEDGILRIGSDAFRELYIGAITIPDSVKTLSNHSFYMCSRLVDLTIPISLDCVASVDNPAFDQCNKIELLKLTPGTTGIGFDYTDYLPIWCTTNTWLSRVTIDSGITYIGTDTFNRYTFTRLYNPMPHMAENLSGHTFTGVLGTLRLNDPVFVDPDSVVDPNSTPSDNSADDLALVLMIGLGLIVVMVAVLIRSYIRYDRGDNPVKV